MARRKNRNRVLALLFVFAMVFSLFANVPVTVKAAEQDAQGTSPTAIDGTEAFWQVDGATLIISGTGVLDSYSDGTKAPWYSAYKDVITAVQIGYGITELGSGNFWLKNVTTVYLPSTVTQIADDAFGKAKSAKSVQSATVYYCTLGEGVDIASAYGAGSLTWEKISHQYWSGGVCALCNKTGYRSGTVESEDSSAKISWTYEDGVLTISGKGALPDFDSLKEAKRALGWYKISADITKIVIGEGITSIGSRALILENVTEIVLAESVKSVDAKAFSSTGKNGVQSSAIISGASESVRDSIVLAGTTSASAEDTADDGTAEEAEASAAEETTDTPETSAVAETTDTPETSAVAEPTGTETTDASEISGTEPVAEPETVTESSTDAAQTDTSSETETVAEVPVVEESVIAEATGTETQEEPEAEDEESAADETETTTEESTGDGTSDITAEPGEEETLSEAEDADGASEEAQEQEDVDASEEAQEAADDLTGEDNAAAETDADIADKETEEDDSASTGQEQTNARRKAAATATAATTTVDATQRNAAAYGAPYCVGDPLKSSSAPYQTFSTLSDAVNYMQNYFAQWTAEGYDTTIYVTSSNTSSSLVDQGGLSNKNPDIAVTLDLNGHQLALTSENYQGTITVLDTASQSQKGMLTVNGAICNNFVISTGVTNATVNGGQFGKFTVSSGAAGYTTIQQGTVVTQDFAVVGGIYTNIVNGIFPGNFTVVDGVATNINGGTFTDASIVVTGGALNINYETTYTKDINVTGGTVTFAKGNYTGTVMIGINATGIINGGTFTSVEADSNNLTVNNCTKIEELVSNGATINGGTFGNVSERDTTKIGGSGAISIESLTGTSDSTTVKVANEAGYTATLDRTSNTSVTFALSRAADSGTVTVTASESTKFRGWYSDSNHTKALSTARAYSFDLASLTEETTYYVCYTEPVYTVVDSSNLKKVYGQTNSLAEAVTYVKNNTDAIICITSSDEVVHDDGSLKGDTAVTLNLLGRQLVLRNEESSGKITVLDTSTNYSMLTVVDSNYDEFEISAGVSEVHVKGVTFKTFKVSSEDQSIVYIDGGNFTENFTVAGGRVAIKGGTFTDASISVSGGKVRFANDATYSNDINVSGGEVQFNQGTYNGTVTIQSGGTGTISGGTFYTVSGTGGTLTVNNCERIENLKTTTTKATINGGSFGSVLTRAAVGLTIGKTKAIQIDDLGISTSSSSSSFYSVRIYGGTSYYVTLQKDKTAKLSLSRTAGDNDVTVKVYTNGFMEWDKSDTSLFTTWEKVSDTPDLTFDLEAVTKNTFYLAYCEKADDGLYPFTTEGYGYWTLATAIGATENGEIKVNSGCESYESGLTKDSKVEKNVLLESVDKSSMIEVELSGTFSKKLVAYGIAPNLENCSISELHVELSDCTGDENRYPVIGSDVTIDKFKMSDYKTPGITVIYYNDISSNDDSRTIHFVGASNGISLSTDSLCNMSVTAGTVSGKTCVGWYLGTDASGLKLCNRATYMVALSECYDGDTYYASYAATGTAATDQMTLTTSQKDTSTIHFALERSIPDAYTVTLVGIKYSTNKLIQSDLEKRLSSDQTADLTSENYLGADEITKKMLFGTEGYTTSRDFSKEKRDGIGNDINVYLNLNVGTSNTEAVVYALGYATVSDKSSKTYTIYTGLYALTYATAENELTAQ